ncbi:5-formyltetrahydrofolate cyclo-ligase [Deferribacteraceae bacterium V6Fe1]|nr:5-formyltetrahydrofolate cyclo-ligase [Deferribacteraceae bacterium V6Fe1]
MEKLDKEVLSKEVLRKKMMTERKKMDFEEVQKRSEKIVKDFLSLFEEMKFFLLYFSFDNEVETFYLAKYLLEKHKEVFAPKLVGNDLKVGKVSDLSLLEKNRYQIFEPVDYFERSNFDVVVVPGVAFDKKCNRLGFGVGYYDRFLPKVKCENIVGFAYEFQVVDELVTEYFDIPMDIVITEKNIYRRN